MVLVLSRTSRTLQKARNADIISTYRAHLLFQGEDGNEDEHVGDEGEEEDGDQHTQLRHLQNVIQNQT